MTRDEIVELTGSPADLVVRICNSVWARPRNTGFRGSRAADEDSPRSANSESPPASATYPLGPAWNAGSSGIRTQREDRTSIAVRASGGRSREPDPFTLRSKSAALARIVAWASEEDCKGPSLGLSVRPAGTRSRSAGSAPPMQSGSNGAVRPPDKARF